MARDAVDLLLESELLRGISAAHLRAIRPPPEWISIKAGDTLIRQGEAGQSFYLLADGRLRVFLEQEGGARRCIGEVMPGEGVGEMSLITGEPTSATVRAVHECSLIRFSRAAYLQLLELSPEAALQITRTVIKRLRASVAGWRRHATFSTIAVVPLDPAIEVSEFTQMLVRAIEAFRPAATLGPDAFDPESALQLRRRERLKPDQDHAVTMRLLEWERGFATVIYQASAEPTEWTRLAIRQADLVLLLATPDSDWRPGEIEASLMNWPDPDLAPRIDLVMLHPGEWRPACGTGLWLEARHITERLICARLEARTLPASPAS